MPSKLSKETASKVVRPPVFKIQIGDEEVQIKPLPDAEIELIGEEISKIVGGLRIIAGVDKIAKITVSDITFGQVADLVPLLINSLVPSSSRVIAASLRKESEWVTDNVFLHDRVRILNLIIEAEGIRELLGELSGLAGLTIPPEMVTAQTPDLIAQAPTSPSPKI